MNLLMAFLVLGVNITHGLLYLRLSTRNPLRFAMPYLVAPFFMLAGMELGERYPAANGFFMPCLLFISASLYRVFVTKDNYSRLLFCVLFVICFGQIVRTPPLLFMRYALGLSAEESGRNALFAYPPLMLLAAPLLLRHVREPFRRMLDIVETQKWYLVCFPPLILSSIGDMVQLPSTGMTDAFIIRSIATIMPLCIVAYFVSLYLFLISHRDKQLLRQQLDAAGRLEHAYAFYGRELEERETRLRTMRHDFRHLVLHLGALARSGDLEGLTRELSSVAKTGDEVSVSPFSENRTVNAVVSYHFAAAEAKGVHCVAKAFVSAELPVPEADLSLLLGNALENCVKGAGPLGERGYVTFSAHPVRGYMAFTFENNYEPGTYATGSRAGLLSIRQICERHNGRMEVTDDGAGRFTLRAFVSMV